LYVVPFVGKFIKLQASDWEKVGVSSEQKCVRIRQEISIQNVRPHDITQNTDFFFFIAEIAAPIQGVFLVIKSVLSLEGKRMGKRAN